MKRTLPKWLWASVAVAGVVFIGVIDFITGFEMNFFVFYFWPVSLAAWYIGMGASVSLSVLAALVWFAADTLSGHSHSWQFYAVWNTVVRLASFIAVGWLSSRIRQLLTHQRKLAEDLQRALSEVKVLETFLPICSQCKKIRDQEGSWQELEEYITAHSNTLFSHGYCPDCAKKAMIEAGLTRK
jgi:low affinity Fe/Cu permease